MASVLDRRLIRLQCYEGIDTNQALYEWDYARQMLQIRALSEKQLDTEQAADQLFGPKFLLERPLLEAVRAGDRAVLLIDEIDRADDEFEAFLLELLSDFQITIPELGTIAARRRPAVILTSNRTRELHDALKRRALFHWIGHPSIEREIEIVRIRVPGIPERLSARIVPISGMLIWKSESTSSRKASNSSSARSISSTSSTARGLCSARRIGRASRKRGS